LIPRPETELLAEATLKAIPPSVPLKVIDAGCGTGCIGITLKLERPASEVVLCDISESALGLAAENAARLCADVQLIRADMRLPFPGGPYDIIVSNPPYIDAADIEGLSPTVKDHEPRLALFGGTDGLDYVRSLADRAADSLRPEGRLFIEVGYNQAEKTIAILNTIGAEAAALPDYSGIPRVVAAWRHT
jgi:release factor glutamine methyltransferase